MTAASLARPRFASPMEAGVHGVYVHHAGSARFSSPPDHRWTSPGRLHLYLGWASAASHRAAIVRSMLGLERAVSVAYVDTLRDARGWAFREGTGADPVNGFTLLREAYERTQPGYDGPVTVPVLWDRHAARILSTDGDQIDQGLATVFGRHLVPSTTEYRALDGWIAQRITAQLGRSAIDDTARAELLGAFAELNARLATSEYLLGSDPTLLDVRLWVNLVRYDAGPNAHGSVGPTLSAYEHLWAYARRLHDRPAFRDTTRLSAIAAPFATLPPWPSVGDIAQPR